RAAHAAGRGARARHQPHDARVPGNARASLAGEVPAGGKAVSCGFSRQVDRHFAGSIDPRSEHSLREHLADCEYCRTRYERRLLIGRLDPRARGAEERLGRGLGVAPARSPWMGLGIAVAATAAALLVLGPRTLHTARVAPDSEFQKRGGKVTKSVIPELQVFQ